MKAAEQAAKSFWPTSAPSCCAASQAATETVCFPFFVAAASGLMPAKPIILASPLPAAAQALHAATESF